MLVQSYGSGNQLASFQRFSSAFHPLTILDVQYMYHPLTSNDSGFILQSSVVINIIIIIQ